MSITLFRSKFLVRIIYKNGASVEMWFHQFQFDRNNAVSGPNGTKVTWECVGNGSSPIVMNTEEIMAIYQMKICVNVFSYISLRFVDLVKSVRK
jgi:hypothetical protein